MAAADPKVVLATMGEAEVSDAKETPPEQVVYPLTVAGVKAAVAELRKPDRGRLWDVRQSLKAAGHNITVAQLKQIEEARVERAAELAPAPAPGGGVVLGDVDP